jgi:hypothetical protein
MEPTSRVYAQKAPQDWFFIGEPGWASDEKLTLDHDLSVELANRVVSFSVFSTSVP